MAGSGEFTVAPNPFVPSGTTPHPRGVFEAEHTFPGVSTFRVYSCTGRLLERREVETRLVDAFTRMSLEAILEHYCPADPDKHGFTCASGGHRSLRVVR